MIYNCKEEENRRYYKRMIRRNLEDEFVSLFEWVPTVSIIKSNQPNTN